MNSANPFMKQLVKQAAPQPQPAPAPAQPPVAAPFMPQMNAPRQPGNFFLPQQGNFTGPAPQLPVQSGPVGPSMQEQLQGLRDRLSPNVGNWEIDPTDPERLVQYSRKF